MKKLFILAFALVLAQLDLFAQAELELKPSQSMSITGKGPGQDAVINPFDGQDCYAIVENVGKGDLSVRTQQYGQIVNILPVKKGEKIKVKLLKGYELYFDAAEDAKTKATIIIEKVTG